MHGVRDSDDEPGVGVADSERECDDIAYVIAGEEVLGRGACDAECNDVAGDPDGDEELY